MVIFNKNFIKTIDKAVNILYNIIVRRILKKIKNMYWSVLIKKFIKTIDRSSIIWYNIIVRGVFYNKKDHILASTRGECSTNIPQINSNDTQRKSLINQVKFPPILKSLQKSHHRNKHRKVLYK